VYQSLRRITVGSPLATRASSVALCSAPSGQSKLVAFDTLV
jgi:hypothetical protein